MYEKNTMLKTLEDLLHVHSDLKPLGKGERAGESMYNIWELVCMCVSNEYAPDLHGNALNPRTKDHRSH